MHIKAVIFFNTLSYPVTYFGYFLAWFPANFFRHVMGWNLLPFSIIHKMTMRMIRRENLLAIERGTIKSGERK